MNDEPRDSRSNYVVVRLREPLAGAARSLCERLVLDYPNTVEYSYPAEFDGMGRIAQTGVIEPPPATAELPE